jgi:hypothetical protein
VHVPEIEVFGISGMARGPLEIEPRAAIVRFEEQMWNDEEAADEETEGPETSRTTGCFIEMADAKGEARRILRGTGLVGSPGDRLFLVERTSSMHCPRGSWHSAAGSWTLVDTRTRLFWDVGALGGVMVDVFRHPEGAGFATSRWDGSEVEPAGAVIVEGKLFRMLRDKEWKFDSSAGVEAWGFTDEGGPCCASADAAAWKRVCKPMGAKKARKIVGAKLEGEEWTEFWEGVELGTGGWLECSAGDVRLILYKKEECEEGSELLATLEKSGRVVQAIGAGALRAGASFETRRLVEALSGDAASIHRIGEDGSIEEVYPDAAFSLPTPTLCACFMN